MANMAELFGGPVARGQGGGRNLTTEILGTTEATIVTSSVKNRGSFGEDGELLILPLRFPGSEPYERDAAWRWG